MPHAPVSLGFCVKSDKLLDNLYVCGYESFSAETSFRFCNEIHLLAQVFDERAGQI